MAVFVHLDDTDQSNGGLGVFPGSHLQGDQAPSQGFLPGHLRIKNFV